MNCKTAIVLATGLIAGCKGFHPVPSLDRSGELYATTRDYTTRHVVRGEDFCGLGKAMVQGGWSGGQAAMIAIPLPTLLLAYPLMWAERVTVCPLVDTLMLPYDLWTQVRLDREVAEGLTVEVVDAWNRPVPDLEVLFRAENYSNENGIVYDGRPRVRRVKEMMRTGADGRCRFPVAVSTCNERNVGLSASLWTAEGRYEAACDDRSGPLRQLRLVPSREWNPFEPTDPTAPRLPPPPGVTLVGDAGKTGLSSFYWTTESGRLEDLYYGAKTVERPADFDAYWDGELARLDREVPFAAECRPMPEASTGALEVCAVSFPSFGRSVQGVLMRPKDGARHPLRIRIRRERRDGEESEIAVREDEVTLVLDVHHPQETPEAKLRERYGFANRSSVSPYAVDGIDRSREAYFFHPFVLGAVRGVRWVIDRPYVDASRVEAEGIRQEAGLGLWLMAFEPRIGTGTFVNPSHLLQTESYATWPKLLAGPGREAERFKARARPHVPYFETLNFAPRIRGRIRLARSGKDEDWQYSDESVFSLFRRLPETTDKKLYVCPKMTDQEALDHLKREGDR